MHIRVWQIRLGANPCTTLLSGIRATILAIEEGFYSILCTLHTPIKTLVFSPLYALPNFANDDATVSSYIPRKTAPPAEIHNVRGITPENRAPAPSMRYIVMKRAARLGEGYVGFYDDQVIKLNIVKWC